MQIGSLIGPYRLLRHLGSGGMGEVWLAEDTRLERQVALKMVRAESDPTSRTRLMKEARAAASLNHPHIATVHDVIEHDGEIVVVFEYVEGETLQSRIARGPMPPPEAVEVASQIARALAGAHAHGIVHRDLKPANVIIGAGGHVKVLDFGIARILSRGTTQTHAAAQPQTNSVMGFVGTASYAAPEQMVSSAVDERADLYALGVVLFEMISGQRPFVGNDPVQLATRKLGTEAPKLSSTGRLVPPALEQLVTALLQRERDHRPASANDVVKVLKHVFGGDSTMLIARRQSRGAALALAATVFVAALGGYGAWQWQTVRSTAATTRRSAPVIAVLPLTNVSNDSSRDFIAAGIAENLISSLATLPSVTVLSRGAVAEARLRLKEHDALIRDLGATYLVEGSVQESGDTLRISLNLVRSDRTIAWGDSAVGSFQSIFDLQSRLASALTNALVVRVSASELERMNTQPTNNTDALAAYWQGKALLDRPDITGNIDSAIAAFDRAVSRDANFGLAHAALGEAYRLKYIDTREPSLAQRAIEEASIALRSDPQRSEVRYVLAVTLAGGGRLKEAVEELNHALAIQPNYEDARRRLGQILAQQGQIDAAISEFQKAIALRPESASPYTSMGLSLFQAGRYKEAADAFTKVTELQPDNGVAFQRLGTVYQQIGDKDRAVLNYRKALEIGPNAQAYSNLGVLYHQRHDYQGAVEAYQKAIELRPNSAATYRNLGDALLKLGSREEAMTAYRKAVALNEADLKVNPNDPFALASSAVFLAKAGSADQARARLDRAIKLAPTDNRVHHRAAVVRVIIGDRAGALESLKLALQTGFPRSAIAEDDEFESLRNDPQFKTLITP